jgi:hypothetical protein
MIKKMRADKGEEDQSRSEPEPPNPIKSG